jgi:hypothetical protein
MIRNEFKLLAGHLESRMRVNFHKRGNSTGFAGLAQGGNEMDLRIARNIF